MKMRILADFQICISVPLSSQWIKIKVIFLLEAQEESVSKMELPSFCRKAIRFLE